MKSVLAVLIKYLPHRGALVALLLALTPLSTFMFYLGSRETREFGTVVAQGRLGQVTHVALLALLTMSIAFGVSYVLSERIGSWFSEAASNMREELLMLFSWARPMAGNPRKMEGGLTSRTSDLERAWTSGASPLIIAVANGIGYLVMGAVIDWWSAACMVSLALLFTGLTELTLGRQRVRSQHTARDRQSAWDRLGRFLARAPGQRLLANRDRAFELGRGRKYNQKRLQETRKEILYTALGGWTVQSGSLVTYVVTQIIYVAHQHLLHQSVTPGAIVVLLIAVSLFQNTLNQGAQGVSTLRRGEVSVGHLQEVLALQSEAMQAQQKATELAAEAETLALQTGRPLAPPKTITVADVTVFSGQQSILDIPHLRMEASSFVCLVGASGSGKSILLNAIAGRLHPNQDGHLPGGLRWSGVVACAGDASGWQYLSAAMIEGTGRWLSLAEPTQSDTIRTFLQSARADAQESDLFGALRRVGLLDVTLHRMDESLNANILTKQQQVLLSLAQIYLLPAWRRSLIVLDESFSDAALGEDDRTRRKVIQILREFHKLGSTIIVAEDSWDYIPREMFERPSGRKKSHNANARPRRLELQNGTVAEVS